MSTEKAKLGQQVAEQGGVTMHDTLLSYYPHANFILKGLVTGPTNAVNMYMYKMNTRTKYQVL